MDKACLSTSTKELYADGGFFLQAVSTKKRLQKEIGWPEKTIFTGGSLKKCQ